MELCLVSQNGGIAHVAASGQISQPDVAPEADPLVQLLGDQVYQSRLLLNLHAVESIDSSGVGWLLTCHRRFRTAGGTIVLHSLSPFVRDVLRILNMHLVFRIADDERAAAKTALDEAS